jgi:UDP-N-acetylglucosamine:LPS N-acetylglucosamine transferase
MDLVYAAADVVISRAGASSVSELCIVGKPVILFLLQMLQKIIKLKCESHSR